jgi:hypothetical protein
MVLRNDANPVVLDPYSDGLIQRFDMDSDVRFHTDGHNLHGVA